MKQIEKSPTIYFLIAGFLFWAWPAFAEKSAGTLTIAADVWCPINCAADDKMPGIGIDLARQIYEPLGYRVEYVIMPWSRALEEVRAGRIDAAVGANHEDEPTLLLPDRPIYHITDDFYVLAENPLVFKSVESLAGQRIGVIRDYGYDGSITSFLDKAKKTSGMVQEVGGDDALEQNIRKLLGGRIDILVESRPIMDYTLMRLKLEKKIKWIGGIPQGDVYLAFSPALPRSRERIRQFDQGIAQLKSAGKLESLYKPYGLHAP